MATALDTLAAEFIQLEELSMRVFPLLVNIQYLLVSSTITLVSGLIFGSLLRPFELKVPVLALNSLVKSISFLVPESI